MKKRGVFFSTDAFIAVSLILLVLLIAYPLIETKKTKTNIEYDSLTAFSSLKIGNLNNSYSQTLISEGKIKDLNKTIIETLGELYVSDIDAAKTLANSLLSEIDTKENIGLWYGSTLIASKNSSPYENSNEIEISKQLISGIEQGKNTTGFSARAYFSNTYQKKYFYFSGYVGDGNLTYRTEYYGNLTNADIEITSNTNFSIYVNNVFAGSYEKSIDEFTPVSYSIPSNLFSSGINYVEFRGKDLHISGGYIRLTYQSSGEYDSNRYYLPGIKGIINLYDGFYLPNLNSLNIYLHYDSSFPIKLQIGNTTIYKNSTTQESSLYFTNSQLSQLLDYNSMINKTNPLRIYTENVSFTGNFTGNADVILITDTSGSMDWRMDSDSSSGISRNCTNSLINDPSTKRISLAKCIDKDFVSTILNGTGNKIALVSFSNNADSYTSLSSDTLTINSAIDAYTASGSTCISCAINRAYQILQSQSAPGRNKFIITMTDGVANVRSTTTCNNLYAAGIDTLPFGAGANGLIIKRESSFWNIESSPTTTQINDLDLKSGIGFAVGNSGLILRWTSSWATIASPITTTLNKLDIYNSTFALAVGTGGKVLKWDGNSWTTIATITNTPTLNSVAIFNSTLAFAVGNTGNNKGKIYKTINGGTTWTADYSPSSSPDLNGIKILNSTLAFAVGDSGTLLKWTGSTWATATSPTNQDLYEIESYNSTLSFAVGGDSGSAIIIKYTSGTWSSSYSSSTDTLRDIILYNNEMYALGLSANIMEYSNSVWQRNFKIPIAYEGNSTSGIICNSDLDSCSEISSFPSLNANYSSCRANNELNSTVYSIGFGPVSTCQFAIQTLQSIASCGNGSYFSSSNASLLKQFYQNIANSILQISYAEQTSSTTGNISSILYPDSYIEFNYTQPQVPFGLTLSTENQFTTTNSGTFSIPLNSRIIDAKVVSYSGPRWTNYISINGQTIYNLSNYGNNYIELGDPSVINIPTSLISENNTIYLTTGISSTNTSLGSQSNKIIYRINKNSSSYSPISLKAEGCIWNVQFEDNSNITFSIPETYSGNSKCYFTSNKIEYDNNDALQDAVLKLLSPLDFNSNNKIDIKFSESDLKITESEIRGIPFRWSTEVQFRTWK